MAAPPPSDTTTLDSTIPETVDSSEQDTSVVVSEPGFGWTHYAEQINGRFAMIGFISLLLMEFLTRQDFFTWIGLR